MLGRHRVQQTRLQRRIGKIQTADLPNWADAQVFSVEKALGLYRRSRRLEALTEALEAAEALYALVRELDRRQRMQ